MRIEKNSSPENHKNPEQIKADGDKERDFKKLSSIASDRSKEENIASSESKEKRADLQDKIQTELKQKQVVSKKTKSHPTIHTQDSLVENSYIRPESELSKKYNNQFVKGVIGTGESIWDIGIATLGVAKGFINSGRDLRDMKAGNAHYDGFKHV